MKSVAGKEDIFFQRIGGGKPINLTPNTPWNDTQPAISPDGQQIAFEGGRWLSGRIKDRSDVPLPGIHLYSPATGRYEAVSDQGEPVAWLDDNRTLLAVGAEGRTVLAVDRITRKLRRLPLELPAGFIAGHQASPDVRR